MTAPSYLIIAGTTKAGTTSLFNYLADHPAICASNVKETRFFLEREYPLEAKFRLEGGLDHYEEFYNQCATRPIRLEATPDYLYSRLAPARMAGALADVHLIFVLRDPIDRLVSWYRFAKQLGRLDQGASFEEFVQRQNLNPDFMSATQYQDAMIQGKYSLFLAGYFDRFGPERIALIQQNGLAQQPQSVLQALCEFAGIDSSPYAEYKFKMFNRTQTMRNVRLHGLYVESIRQARNRVHNKPMVMNVLRKIRRILEPLYLRLNRNVDSELEMAPATRRFLEEFYQEEPARLARLLNIDHFSWQDASLPIHLSRR